MTQASLARVGVSTWALHHLLGAPPAYGTEAGDLVPSATSEQIAEAMLPLLELPAELARRKFDAFQLCHFHLPTRDPKYLTEVRAAIAESGVSLQTLLVDAGDMTHPTDGARDEAWIAAWLPVAASLGAPEIRVIAGKTVDAGAMDRSVAALHRLTRAADAEGIAITTENWFPLLSTPAAVHEALDRCPGIRLLLDFGNWTGPTKYADLAQIAPRATSCHAKASFDDGGRLDEQDYLACLTLPYPAGFRGPFFLVNSRSGEQPWNGLEEVMGYIRAHAGD